MIGRTLGLYLARDFARNVLLIFLLFFFLIVAVDLIELSRELGKVTDAGFTEIFLISMFRAPAFAENILPFAVMFGAITSLLLLNRRLELVVARASGVSVWQFLLPLVVSAALLGGIASTAYNPISLLGQTASRALEAKVFGAVKGGFSNKSNNFWLRLERPEGDVVLRARVAQEAGTRLTAVSAYIFSPEGDLTKRADAASAQFVETGDGDAFELIDATISEPGVKSQEVPQFSIPVSISKSQLQSDQTTADSISLWGLGKRADQAERAGKNELPFLTRFQALLAQPILFVAMVLVAATVSLTFARFGTNGRLILGGVCAGFVVYILSKLVITFGSNGLVSPFIAAWSPALVATLIGITVLLHQEDG